MKATKTILWWGRFDPAYSRNRILRSLLGSLGWRIVDFRPAFSRFGSLEAAMRRLPEANLVWVPCFRQRDLAAARRWSRHRGLPLVFDPLISAYDKQVYEREKVAAAGRRGERLRKWESRLLNMADLVLADTQEHARFFVEALGMDRRRLLVVPVGAEEELFHPSDAGPLREGKGTAAEVLFYGSFIPLQGPRVIAEAIRLYRGPPVLWRFIGHGPLLQECRAVAGHFNNVCFDPWVPYDELPAKIRQADILLGIFGATPKAGRVVPNKVYQAIACGKPVVTCRSAAYPRELLQGDSGLIWVSPNDPAGLAAAVSRIAGNSELLKMLGQRARENYLKYFSSSRLLCQLEQLETRLFTQHPR